MESLEDLVQYNKNLLIMESLEDLVQYNEDNSVNIPFGRTAEWYINNIINHPLLKNICLRCQTQRKTSELIKKGLISISRVEGAVDYIEWNTKNGDIKSTNRIDDIIKLTSKGEEYVKQIEAKRINYVGFGLCSVQEKGIVVNMNVEELVAVKKHV